MENKFARVMSKRTDEELIKIATIEREGYKKIAIEAADAEIKKRNIDTSTFEQIIRDVTTEEKIKEKVDSNLVSAGIRFINFLIDGIVCLVLTYTISFVSRLVIQTTNQVIILIIGYILIFGTFIGYYAIMEVKFQKTIGKFVTNTKVVKINGEKPTNGDIITRTFCRLIPFDRLSFLFVKSGIHDFLSKTRVVKDNIE